MSWMPQYSRQLKHERNCGQHCVAMITHLSVELICKEVGHNKGTHPEDLRKMLWWFGVESEFITSGGFLPRLCIIHIKHHWAVYFDGIVYDSCLGIKPIGEYRYKIKRFIKIEVPNG